MFNDFKKIKFRNKNIVYTADAVDLSNTNVSANANFLIWIAAFRIYNDEEELIGKITFQQSMLLDYLWADPKKTRFPSKSYLEEALVNLLHYLPFDKDTLNPEGDSFIFRFIRDLENGREKNARVYNIKVEKSMEKSYQIIMFGDQINDEKLSKAILEPLYMHRLDNFSTNLPVDLIRSILPFDQNKIDSQLEILEYNKFVDILRDASGAYISLKIRPEGVESLLGHNLHPIEKMAKKIQIGHNFHIKTGDNSPVNIQADIDTSFESVKKEIDQQNLLNKTEIMNDLNLLQEEIKSPGNLDTIKNLLGKIWKSSAWVGRRIEPIVQQVIASYISSQLPVSPLR